MLRVDILNSGKAVHVTLAGRFAGEDAEHVRMQVAICNMEGGLIVDLTEVTFIDAAGEATLSFFSRLGAKFVAEDVFVLGVCQRLRLPITRDDSQRAAEPRVKIREAEGQD